MGILSTLKRLLMESNVSSAFIVPEHSFWPPFRKFTRTPPFRNPAYIRACSCFGFVALGVVLYPNNNMRSNLVVRPYKNECLNSEGRNECISSAFGDERAALDRCKFPWFLKSFLAWNEGSLIVSQWTITCQHKSARYAITAPYKSGHYHVHVFLKRSRISYEWGTCNEEHAMRNLIIDGAAGGETKIRHDVTFPLLTLHRGKDVYIFLQDFPKRKHCLCRCPAGFSYEKPMTYWELCFWCMMV
jgi:hypothetical protein